MNPQTHNPLDNKTIIIEVIGGCRDGEVTTKAEDESLIEATREIIPGPHGGFGFAALWDCTQQGTVGATFRVSSPTRDPGKPNHWTEYTVTGRTETDTELIIECRVTE